MSVSTSPLRVRRYQKSDHAVVVELHYSALRAAGADAGQGPWDDDLNAIETTYLESGGEFLVGYIGDALAGMGALRRLSAEKAELKRTRVRPDLQRKGYGQQMLGVLERSARDLGYSVICLDTTDVQRAAQELYRKNGYVETGRKRHGKHELLFFEKTLTWPGA